MLKSEKTTIDGVGYEVTQLPYTQGRKLLLRLYKTLGPALAKGFANAPTLPQGASVVDVSVKDLAPAFGGLIEGLADNLSEEDFDYLTETLAECTCISTEKDKWVPLKSSMEFHFAGNYGEMFAWLGFALKVNFGGFTKGQGSLTALLAKVRAAAKASQSRTTSTGGSTE